MVNLTYSLNATWQIVHWHSPDGSCTCRDYEGRSLLHAISDLTLRHLFQLALERVVSRRKPLELTLRCDTPDMRREAYVHLRPSARCAGGVDAENGTLSRTMRPPIRSLEAGYISSQILHMCSWCKRVEIARGSWIEIEDAQNALYLFEHDRPPMLTHGLCGYCYDTLARQTGLAPRNEVAAPAAPVV